MRNSTNSIHPIRKLVVALLLVFASSCGFAQRADSVAVYIPADLEDCMRQLDSMFSSGDKSLVWTANVEEFVNSQHFSMGMWMRNNWGLWGNSRLKNYFVEQGIRHPDDMSGVILRCYYHFAKGERVNYKKLLQEGKKAEKAWLKPINKANDEEWEYEDRYDCRDERDTFSVETASAFLGLPKVVDSEAGSIARIRNWGDSITEDILNMEQSLKREPHRKPVWDYLVNNVDVFYGRNPKGSVKKMLITEVDESDTVEFDFNRDGFVTRFQHRYARQNGTANHIDEHYAYGDKGISQVTEYENDTIKKVLLYRYSDSHHCQELEFKGSVWHNLETYQDTISQAMTISKVVFSPEGQVLAIFRPWGCVLSQYDSLGRMVTWLSSYDDQTVDEWLVVVYDDNRRVVYKYNGDSDVYATVLNEKGDFLGTCCAQLLDTYDYKKTMYRYRYDRHGNWIRMYEKGQLIKRCKIWYY